MPIPDAPVDWKKSKLAATKQAIDRAESEKGNSSLGSPRGQAQLAKPKIVIEGEESMDFASSGDGDNFGPSGNGRFIPEPLRHSA